MQRKLSAIAEIPKILSSTLATVSQSFGTEAVYKRKCSYDEDALDYELLEQPESEGDEDVDEEETEEEEEDDLVQVQDDDANDLAVKQYKSKALKDATPESDYASEANYATNETSDEDDDADEIYYIKLPVMPAGGDFNEAATADAVNISSEDDDDDDDDDDVNVDEADNKSDFLSTTYTWNLRNVPKLRRITRIVEETDGRLICDRVRERSAAAFWSENGCGLLGVPKNQLASVCYY
ncbi:hypothetical protein ACLKA6_002435 [Drosophila palustris]